MHEETYYTLEILWLNYYNGMIIRDKERQTYLSQTEVSFETSMLRSEKVALGATLVYIIIRWNYLPKSSMLNKALI